MEDRKAHSVAISLVILLIIGIIVARLTLKLSKTFFLICGADVAAIFAVFAIFIIRRRFNNRRQLLEMQRDSDGRELRIEYSFLRKVAGVPIRFKLKELEEATDHFFALIGRGSSASVFKGILIDGTSVAVKRIEGEDQERSDKEFRSEVAAIASVQHVNLVRLVGYSSLPVSGPRFLVYEYILNGSLDNWIFPRREIRGRRSGCLSWDLRYRVALDVAKALAYLHHDCRSCILHLDVKPENILLDENYRARVSDFGLSKLMGKDESRVVTTIRGTRGYLAPEWILENGVSEKSDVYSYGMVLFEMVGGRRNVSAVESHGNHEKGKKKFKFFPNLVCEKLREGKIMEIVDERLVEVGEREVKRLVSVALWCIQERPRLRPTMAQVVEMLEGLVHVEAPPETQMLILDLLANDDDDPMPRHPRTPRTVALVKSDQMDTIEEIEEPSSYSLTMSVLSGR